LDAVGPAYIFAHLGQLVANSLHLFPVESGKRLVRQVFGQGTQLVANRLCLFGQEKAPGTTIGRIRLPLDQPSLLQTVDDPAGGDRLNVQPLG